MKGDVGHNFIEPARLPDNQRNDGIDLCPRPKASVLIGATQKLVTRVGNKVFIIIYVDDFHGHLCDNLTPEQMSEALRTKKQNRYLNITPDSPFAGYYTDPNDVHFFH